jgi:hypothetical protein
MPIKFIFSPPPAPPAQANIIHRWNLTDISTLWQNTGGTTPVVSDSDPVGRVDDLIGTTNLLQGVAGDRPIWDASQGTVRGVSSDQLVGQYVGTPTNLTIAVLGMEETAVGNGAFSPFTIHQDSSPFSFDRATFAASWNFGTISAVSVQLQGQSSSFSTTGYAAAQQNSTIYRYTDLDIRRFWVNWVAGSVDNNGPNAGQLIEINAAMSIFDGSWTGWVREVIVWDIPITDLEIADLQAYDTATHGTVWA